MRFILLFFLTAYILTGTLFSAELDVNLKQLEQVRSRILQAERSLAKKEKSEISIARELALLQGTIARIDEDIAKLSRKQSRLKKEIEQQKQEIAQAEKQVAKVGKRLESRLIALYKDGDAGALSIIFSADSPTEMIQQYQYLSRIMEHDQQLLDDYRSAVRKQRQGLVALEDLEQQQEALIVKQQKERDNAKEGRSLQARLLKQARSQKQQLTNEIAQLNEKAKRLKGLVTELKNQQQEQEVTVAIGEDFKSLKGRLDWPLNGPVIIGFGKQRDASLGTIYESNGIEIQTPLKTPIKAVAGGKVAFASYFKGYGNLMILSHLGKFHTLYAQIDRLSKKVGDQVTAGEVLGYSGLDGRKSIYFEVRSNGTPVNPLSWLKHR
jgi:septal ring factor EnvC (AmiA/AmiB activator)